MSAPRVGIACVFHESNTAIPEPTTLADARRQSLPSEAMLGELGGTHTATGGFVARGRELGFELVPVAWTRIVPSGPLDREAFETLAAELEAALRAAAPLAGLLLELHGAMTAEGHVRADGELAAHARAGVGAAPIACVIDPHANLAPALAEHVDVLLAYQENPHVDMAQRGHAGADALAAMLAGGPRPATATRRVPIVVPAIAQATGDEPLRTLVAEARALERRPGIVTASVVFGYAYADVPDLGMTAVVVADDQARADREADALAARCWELRADFARELLTPAEAVARAASLPGLTALADTGDNVGGGARGDSSTLAAALLAHGGIRAATTIADAGAARAAAAAGPGGTVELAVGAPPLDVSAVVRSVGSGSFVQAGLVNGGLRFDPGAFAVLDVASLAIVVHERPVPPNAPTIFEHAGVDLAALDAVVLKGAAALRAGWADTAATILDVASPGPTTSIVADLTYLRATRPLWPLDE
jgi:microcystin degradation protein MlrC